MKILLIIFSVLLWNDNVYSQPYFSKMFDLIGAWESANNLLSYDSVSKKMILSGTFINFGVNDTTQYRHAYIWSLDSNGQTEIKSIYAYPPDDMIGFSPFKSGKSLILKGEIQKRTTQYENNFLLFITNSGDTIKKIMVDYPVGFNSTAYCFNNDKIVSFGLDITKNPWPLAILCYDTSGKQLWYKVFSNRRVYPYNAVLTNENNILLGGAIERGDGITDTSFGWYAKIDTLGNILWEKTLDGKDGFLADYAYVSASENTCFISGGNGGGFPSLIKDSSYCYIAKIDNKGSVLWRKNFLYTDKDKRCDVGNMLYKNNFLYAYVDYNTSEGWANITQYVALVKLDTLGNLKWKRLFKQWYMDNRAFSLTSVPDGFIICADGKDTAHTTGFSDAWIIKTDTNGCIKPGCHLNDGIVEVLDPGNYVKLYPNPANTEINIVFKDPGHTKIDLVEVLDSEGRSLLTQKVNDSCLTLSTEALPNGIYYIAAYFNGSQRIVKKVLVQHE